jgi:Ca2+-transporting ATPase
LYCGKQWELKYENKNFRPKIAMQDKRLLARRHGRSMSAANSSRQSRLDQKTRKVWSILCLAVKKFLRIDGAQWAGAFAFNAFFSLFPLMVLLVTIASYFIDQDRAGKEVVAHIERYVPTSAEMQNHIFNAIASVVKARKHVGAVAFLILVWVALKCFTTLICATNRAWGITDYNWWRLPLKSLVLLGITVGAVLLGMAGPALVRIANNWFFTESDFHFWVYTLGSFFIPLLFVFFGLSLFYKLAPRRPTRFIEVWIAALCATALLQAAESPFVIYLKNFATLNVVFGAIGGIMALLLWIYVSGYIFIFGACLCAALAEMRSQPIKTRVARVDKRNEA